LTFVVVFGQIVSVTFGSFVSGRPLNMALRTGMSLAQIGEFSYIIAQVGVTQGNVGEHVYDVAVAVSIVTAFTTPWLIRVSDPFARLIDSVLPKPIQTFSALYGSWLEELRHGGAEETVWSRSRRLVRSIAIDTFFLAGIIITTASTLKKWVPRLQQLMDLSPITWKILLITIGCMIALPFLVGVLRCAKTLAALIATSAIPEVGEGELDLGQAPRKALTLTLQLGILFAIGFPLMALTQPFLPSGYSPVLFATLLAFLGVVFWKSAVNLHEHVQAGAQMMAQAISQRAPEKREEAMEQVNTMVPGIGAPESVPVPAGCAAVGKTLGELNLRSRVGANVIAIMRGTDRHLMPGGKEMLKAGDVLVLVGTQQAVRQAKEALQKNSAS
jgi:CPA2 family monovalent cation:H+ antiporter-2